MNKKKRRHPSRGVARHIKKRAGIVFLVILMVMCFLLIRIMFISRNQGKDYNKTILSQMSYNSKTIPAERGRIFDRNGSVLAYNENQYTIVIEPKNILENAANAEATKKALSSLLSCEEEEVQKLLNENPESYYKRIMRGVSQEKKDDFEAFKKAWENDADETEHYLEKDDWDEGETVSAESSGGSGAAVGADPAVDEQAADSESQSTEPESAGSSQTTQSDTQSDSEEASGGVFHRMASYIAHLFGISSDTKTENKGKIVGVLFEKEQKRVYPYDSLASTTIGFTGSEGGVTGLEQEYDDLLKGVDGRSFGYMSTESSVDMQTVEKTDGYSLVTTLDVYIQSICQKLVDEYDSETGSNVTALMVTNPNNGEIYAMASSNPYDLNNPRDLSPYYSEEELEAMTDEERSEKLLLLWRNFCTSESFEPGSTAKIFTVAAGLEEDAFKPNSYYKCDGVGEYGGRQIHCHKVSGHGTLSVTGSLMASCNDVLMQLAAKVGVEDFCKYQSLFNLGKKTGIDLPGELSCAQQIYHADNMSSVDLATNSFGQNFYVTMLQMCAAYSAAVNGGNYYVPHVVKQVLNSEGNVVQNIEPILLRKSISEDTSAFIREALFETCENGTANLAKIEGYEIGAKTGTAEKFDVGDEDEKYTVSLMAVAPALDPEVIVYAVIDEPHVPKEENTYQAKNLCKAAMEKILPYLNIYPTADDDGTASANGDFTSPEEDEMYDDGVMNH